MKSTLLKQALTLSALASSFIAAPVAFADPDLNAAVLPGARSGQVGDTLTFFATISNSGDTTATNCIIRFDSSAPGSFSAQLTYQATDAGNAVTGPANPTLDIPAGQSQGYAIAITPESVIDPGQDIALLYTCDNGSAPRRYGVNTLFVRAVDGAATTPDVIPILQTLSGDGIMRLPDAGDPRQQVLVAAATNIGDLGPVTVTPFFPRLKGPLDLLVCETTGTPDGSCLPEFPFAQTLTTTLPGPSDPPATFTMLAILQGDAGITFRPDLLRTGLVFTDPDTGAVVGSTDAALLAQGPVTQGDDTFPFGIYHFETAIDGEAEQPPSLEQSFMLLSPDGIFESVSLSLSGGYSVTQGQIIADPSTEPGGISVPGDLESCSRGSCETLSFAGLYNLRDRLFGQLSGDDPDLGPFTGSLYASYTKYSDDVIPPALAGTYDVYELEDFSNPIGSADLSNGTFTGDVQIFQNDIPVSCSLTAQMTIPDPLINGFQASADLLCGPETIALDGVGAMLPWIFPPIGPAPDSFYMVLRAPGEPADPVVVAFVPEQPTPE